MYVFQLDVLEWKGGFLQNNNEQTHQDCASTEWDGQ